MRRVEERHANLSSLFCLSCVVYLTRSIVGKGEGEEDEGKGEISGNFSQII